MVKALEKSRIQSLDKEYKFATDCDALNNKLSKRDVNRKATVEFVELMQDFHFEMVHRSGQRMKHVGSQSRNEITIISSEENLAPKVKILQGKRRRLEVYFQDFGDAAVRKLHVAKLNFVHV